MRYKLRFILFFLLTSYLVPTLAFDNRLYNAIYRGDTSQVEGLIAGGVDPNQPVSPNSDASALMVASATGKTDIARILIANGANINFRSSDGNSALKSAIRTGSIDIVKILLPKTKDKDADIAETINGDYGQGQTLLMTLLKHKYKTKEMRKEMIQFALAHGAKIEPQNKNGFTALIFAITTGDNEIVNLLIKHGADLEVKNTVGYNALMVALVTEGVNMDIVNTLIEKGAKLDAVDFTLRDRSGNTLLANAARSERPGKIKFILKSGAQINATNKLGYTPLMIAAEQGNINVVKLLLAHDADVQIKARDGQNAYRASVAGKNFNITQILEKKGAHL